MTINETFDLELPTQETYETIAGLVLNRAGRLVDEGEHVDAHGVRIDPIQVEDGRILKVRLEHRPRE